MSDDTVRVERARSLSIEGLSIEYGGHIALNRVTLRIESGTTMALLGPSGSGKTSLLRAVAGLLRPTTGSIRAGSDVLSDPSHLVAPERRRIGMVFQHHVLFPHLNVADNVGFGLSKESRRNGRVEEVLELVGLTGLGSRDPATLSGGQQQRVSLARALAPAPDLLLLDEPFASLDASLRVELRREIQRMIVAVGVTTLFVTHDQDEAFALGDRVAVLHEGNVIQSDTPEELYEHPATLWLAGFVGEANLLPGVMAGGTRHASTILDAVEVEPASAGMDVGPSAPVTVLIRPEQIRLGITSADDAPIGTHGRVLAAEYRGATTLLSVLVGDTQVAVLVSRSDPVVRVGDTVVLTVGSGPFLAWSRTDPCASEG